MKKALIILAVLVVLAVAAVAVFIATFDADRYRPLIVEQLQKALGRPVSLDRISLAWRNGISAQLTGLVVAGETPDEALLRLELAAARVQLWPLLRKDVQVTAVLLRRPEIRVARDAQGKINLLGLAAVASPAAVSHPASAEGQPVSLDIESVNIEDGIVHWTDALAQPVAKLAVNDLDVTIRNISPGEPMDVALKAAVAGTTQNVAFDGKVLIPFDGRQGYVKAATINIQQLTIDDFLPAAAPGQPRGRGKLSAQLTFDVPSFESAQLLIGLGAQGDLQLTDFTVENFNLLRAVFDKLSVLPGLVQRLQSRLPPEYLQRLNETATRFEPVTLPIQWQRGGLIVESLSLRTDTLAAALQGRVGVAEQSLSMQGVLQLEPQLSSAIIRSVEELSALTNAAGEIEMPLAIQGPLSHPAVMPDVKYVASRVVVTKAVDLIQQYLAPKPEEGQEGAAAAADQPSTEQAPPPTTEELIGTLLQRALKKQ